jgi:16S rRNA processing protein RimM
MNNKNIVIAKITSVFGIKGEVKMVVYCDDVLNIEKYALFDANGREFKVKISNKNKTVIGSTNGDPIIIAKIEGVNDRNESETLRGVELLTNRKNFKKTAKDEFYYVDLIGLKVVDKESKKLGVVLNVFDHGAGGILEIEFDEKNLPKNYGKIENFPFKNEFFPEVNIEEGFILIDLPEVVIGKEK